MKTLYTKSINDCLRTFSAFIGPLYKSNLGFCCRLASFVNAVNKLIT